MLFKPYRLWKYAENFIIGKKETRTTSIAEIVIRKLAIQKEPPAPFAKRLRSLR